MNREDQLAHVDELDTPELATTDRVRMFRPGERSFTATIAELQDLVGSGGGGVAANITLFCSDDSTNHVVTVGKDAETGKYFLDVDQSSAGGTASTLTLTCSADSSEHAVTIGKDTATGKYFIDIDP